MAQIIYTRPDKISELDAADIVPDPLTALHGIVEALENLPVNLPAELHSALLSGKIAAEYWRKIP